MISLKHIPKLFSRNTSGSTACRGFMTGAFQKSFLSTAMAAETTDYSDIEVHSNHVLSTFNLHSIGVGPTSSHTIGPMSASKIFIDDLKQHNLLDKVFTLRVDMFGSLALKGKGNGTPEAILMGIEGENTEIVKCSTVKSRVQNIYSQHCLHLDGTHTIHFNPDKHLVFNYFKTLPQHLNGIRFCAFDSEANVIATNKYFIGGGFIVNEPTQMNLGQNLYYKDNASFFKFGKKTQNRPNHQGITVTLPFRDAEDLMQTCKRENLTISQVVQRNRRLKPVTPKYSGNQTIRLLRKIAGTG